MRKFIFLIAFALCATLAFAQPSTVTYQGILTDNAGALINGNRDLVFKVYDAANNGTLLATDTHAGVTLTNGLFNVELNIGSVDFSQNLWLEITVAGTVLTPRVKFNATGYALAGKATSLQISTNAGEGKVLTSDANGNASWANTPSLSYFTESRNTTSPNNTIPAHVLSAVGSESDIDLVLSPKGYGAILASLPDGFIGGNKRGYFAVDLQIVRNEQQAVANGYCSIISGGFNNKASGNYSLVSGGGWNAAYGASSTISGGLWNLASGQYSTTSGGYLNSASGMYSTVIGGYDNTAQSYGETVAGLSATIGSGNSTSFVSTDRLFVIGNGTDDMHRSDALTVLKNGNTTIAGGVQVGLTTYNTNGDMSGLVNYSIIKYTYNGAVTNLPPAVNYTGKILYIINSSSASRTINSVSVADGKVIQLISDGSTWFTVTVTP